MSLLSNTEISEIRAAVKLATDTFMVTEVKYRLDKGSFDRYGESNARPYTEYTFNCLAEYPKNQSNSIDVDKMGDGSVSDYDIMLTVNLEDLAAVNLVSAPNWLMPSDGTKDYFVVKGIEYRVTSIKYDGPLETKNVLCLIEGTEVRKNS